MTDAPLGLIAELTHRCPLQCIYCSNPLELIQRSRELSTETWLRILGEAADLGMLHVYFTGGEPCVRTDLVELVRAASARGLYVNLITSGLGLTQTSCDALCAAGLNHIQLSLQDIDREGAKRIGGVDALEKKKKAAEIIRRSSAAMTVNIVVHRANLERLDEMIDAAVDFGASKLEIAHVQFNGWALKNKNALLPTLDQLRASIVTIEKARERLKGRARIDFVLPDYYAKTPKPCMNGWARKMMLIDPEGRVLPCHSATIIPNVEFPSAQVASLKAIWEESELFNMFRGTDWMPAACRSCDRRDVDFGGCRCQALAFTGDAAQMDPVCHRSPFRERIDDAIRESRLPNSPPVHRRIRG